MKWAIIDNCGTDEYKELFDSKEQAIEAADIGWNGLTDTDKKRRDSYLVCLINVDENGDYNEDDNGNIDADIYEIAKEYK